MSGVTAMGVLAGAAVAGTVATIYNGVEQKKTAKQSMQQAQANVLKQEKAADQAFNAQNKKHANTGAALDSATQAGKAGASGTMLTGPQGVDLAALNLGKNTLLGS